METGATQKLRLCGITFDTHTHTQNHKTSSHAVPDLSSSPTSKHTHTVYVEPHTHTQQLYTTDVHTETVLSPAVWKCPQASHYRLLHTYGGSVCVVCTPHACVAEDPLVIWK